MHRYLKNQALSKEVDKKDDSNKDFSASRHKSHICIKFQFIWNENEIRPIFEKINKKGYGVFHPRKFSDLPHNLTKGSNVCVKYSLQLTSYWNNKIGLIKIHSNFYFAASLSKTRPKNSQKVAKVDIFRNM